MYSSLNFNKIQVWFAEILLQLHLSSTYRCCHNPNSTLCYIMFDMKMTLHTTPTVNSMSAISQLLLTHCWPNFKGMFLEPSSMDVNCFGDICPVNICPGDICPYQEYLSCYRLNFDQTLKVDSKKKLLTLILLPKIFSTQNLLDLTFFGHKSFLTLIFWITTFWAYLFFYPNFFLIQHF